MRNMVSLNRALLGKWSSHFAKEMGALWHSVISGKYGVEEGGWCSCLGRGAYGVGVWKAKRMQWDVVGSRMAFAMGNGRRVRLWLDRWCGNEPLRDASPYFALATSIEAWVVDVWHGSTVEGCWAPCLCRNLND